MWSAALAVATCEIGPGGRVSAPARTNPISQVPLSCGSVRPPLVRHSRRCASGGSAAGYQTKGT